MSTSRQLSNILPFGRKEEVKKPVIKTRIPESEDVLELVKPEGGWEPLGIDRAGRYVVLSYLTGTVRAFGPADCTGPVLEGAFGIECCRTGWDALREKTRKHKLDVLSLADCIRESCQAQGLVDDVDVRHAGLYRHGEHLVVHYGQQVQGGRRPHFPSGGCL